MVILLWGNIRLSGMAKIAGDNRYLQVYTLPAGKSTAIIRRRLKCFCWNSNKCCWNLFKNFDFIHLSHPLLRPALIHHIIVFFQVGVASIFPELKKWITCFFRIGKIRFVLSETIFPLLFKIIPFIKAFWTSHHCSPIWHVVWIYIFQCRFYTF